GTLSEDTGRRAPPPEMSDPFAQPVPSSRGRARAVPRSSSSPAAPPPRSSSRGTARMPVVSAALETRRQAAESAHPRAYERDPTLMDFPVDDDDDTPVTGLEIGNTLVAPPLHRNESTLLQPSPVISPPLPGAGLAAAEDGAPAGKSPRE